MEEPEHEAPGDRASELIDLIERLEAEAEFVDRGRFSLDLQRAGEKLEAYRVSDPAIWIVLVVEAATLLGADSVRVYFGQHRKLLVWILGATLEPDELRQLPSALGARVDESVELEGPRREGIKRLAAALQLLPAREVVALAIDTYAEQPLSLTWRREGPTIEFSTPARASQGVYIEVEAKFDLRRFERKFRPERELLVSRCMYARIDVRVDDEPIVRDLGEPLRVSQSTWTPRPTPLLVDGEHLGYYGFEPGQQGGSRLLVLVNGVLIETIKLAQEPDGVGFMAIVDSSRLRRDLSLSKIVRDDEFERLIAAVENARRGWLDQNAYAIRSRQTALVPAHADDQIVRSANTVGFGVSVAWLGLWLWLWMTFEAGIFAVIGFFGVFFAFAYSYARAEAAARQRKAARADD